MFEVFSQAQLVSLLKRFFTYQAWSEQSINEVFTKLSLIHTQIDEIDSTLVSDEQHQTIILQTAVDQKLYQLSIILLESKQELNLYKTIYVLKKAESKIRLTNKLIVKLVNYTKRSKQSDNQSHYHD